MLIIIVIVGVDIHFKHKEKICIQDLLEDFFLI